MTMGSQSFEDYCFFGPWGSLTPTGDLILETRAWRERLFTQRAEHHPSAHPPDLPEARRVGRALHLSRWRYGRRHGRAGAEPVARADGRDRRGAVLPPLRHQPCQHDPRRHLLRPEQDRQSFPAPARAATDHRAGLLHRRHQRPDRPARPGADPSGPDGASCVVPHADARGSQGHLRPVPEQGRSRRPTSTPTAAATSWRGSPTATRRR